MWKKQISIQSRVQPGRIWQQYARVDQWHVWDAEVEWASLNGPFREGATGELKPKGGPKTAFTITSYEPERSFTTRSSIPFGKMDIIHHILPEGDTWVVTHTVQLSGPLSGLFAQIMGKKIVRALPLALSKLVEIAEQQEPHHG